MIFRRQACIPIPSLRLKMSAGVGFEPTTNGAALGADELPSITPRESE